MKVLISAYACEPGRGSEPGVGWHLVRELSARHELWVLTRANNEAAIRASGEDWVERVRWVFLDPPAWTARWKKSGPGLMGFYLLWQSLARKRAQELLEGGGFEVAHHLTFGNYLPPSPLAELGVPFTCGPVGGGEYMPPDLFDGCDLRTKWLEWSRGAARALAGKLPRVRSAYREAAGCLAATPLTAEALRDAGARHVVVCHQSGIGDDEIGRLETIPLRFPSMGEPLRLVAASRLIHWKGIDLAIDAVALAIRSGLEVRLEILQDGPERERLERRVTRLGLGDHVVFRGRLPSMDEVHRVLAGADALIHPAWHEAFGQACLESLAMGVPVICLDWAGPGRMVDDTCGYKAPVGSRSEVVSGLAAAMRRALEDRPRRSGMVLAAKRRVRGRFGWDAVARRIEDVWLGTLR